MKRSALISMVVALALLASGAVFGMSHEKEEGMGATTGIQHSQVSQQSDLAPMDQLSNFQVQSLQGENLGQVQDVIVDLNEGRIGYVVIGSGELAQTQKYIVPWKALQPSMEQNALTLTVDKAQLMSAPEGDIQQALTRQEGQEIHRFYGVAPYWEEGGMEEVRPDPSLQPQQELQQQEIQPQERQQLPK